MARTGRPRTGRVHRVEIRVTAEELAFMGERPAAYFRELMERDLAGRLQSPAKGMEGWSASEAKSAAKPDPATDRRCGRCRRTGRRGCRYCVGEKAPGEVLG